MDPKKVPCVFGGSHVWLVVSCQEVRVLMEVHREKLTSEELEDFQLEH